VKVLHVAQSSEYGLGRYLADLVADQAGRGWDVAVAGHPQSWLRPEALAAGATWHDWSATRQPGPSVLGEARALARVVADVAPDVVHLHSSKAGLAGRLAIRGRRPTIFQPHAWSFLPLSGGLRAGAVGWERLAARWADAIVCCSQAEQVLGAAHGVRAREWQVVKNAVDTDRYLPGDSHAARARLGWPADVPLVVCAGRVAVAQKGQDRLLAAWPLVEAAVPGARLAVVGDGPDRAALERDAPASVSFVGHQDDVVAWLQAADVVVQPSRYEGLSLVVLEALAVGRPVVATDAVGMREAICEDGDGQGPAAGAVVPPEDPAGLADAMTVRLRDPGQRLREGQAGRERAVRSHDLRSWGQQLAAVTAAVAGHTSGG
jgi:glycosyltransferase involved in cell wall biosynthesis